MPCLWMSIVSGCAHHAAPTSEPSQYAYAMTPPTAGSSILRVEARFEHASSAHLVLPEADGAVRDMVIVDDGGERPLTREGNGWLAGPCRARCTVRYAVDLEALAASCRSFDCSRRVGDA